MDLATSFDEVVRIANRAPSASAGWVRFCKFLSAHVSVALVSRISSVDIDEDIQNVRAQLVAVLASAPPPQDTDALYFGLFDTLDEDDREGIGCYVSGVRGFNPDDGDTLCKPVWWPLGRHLHSRSLDAVKAAELDAAAGNRSDEQEFLAYAGQLGSALIVTRFAVGDLSLGRTMVVGFDSGDYATIDV